jgi:hypothetical protein
VLTQTFTSIGGARCNGNNPISVENFRPSNVWRFHCRYPGYAISLPPRRKIGKSICPNSGPLSCFNYDYLLSRVAARSRYSGTARESRSCSKALKIVSLMHTGCVHGDAVNAEREREREGEGENNIVKNRLARVRIATDHERRAPACRASRTTRNQKLLCVSEARPAVSAMVLTSFCKAEQPSSYSSYGA